jgi:hypothetical protein
MQKNSRQILFRKSPLNSLFLAGNYGIDSQANHGTGAEDSKSPIHLFGQYLPEPDGRNPV